jgi:hypothetical protein
VPWHLSKSNPCKIYDERHEVAALATSPEHAARIVAAVTGKSQEVVRLKEPAKTFDFADGGPVPEGKTYLVGEHVCETVMALNSFEDDECCAPRIAKAGREGRLKAATAWTCPKCGCDWTVAERGAIRHWSPVSDVMILRRP